MSSTRPLSRQTAIIAIGGAGFLVLLGIAALWLAADRSTSTINEDVVTLSINNSACEPAELSVPAGRRSFVIQNDSDRTLEWEILDGVMVLAERENITPGLSVTVTQQLKAGTYDITCGLLSNPRGRLTVVATAESEAIKRQPEIRGFIGPLAEYRVFLNRRTTDLVEAVTALKERIGAQDIEGAKNAWLTARVAWNSIAPIWSTVGDLQAQMDPQAEYLTQRENDPAFIGFHRIEHGLWAQNSTVGLAEIAETLTDDTVTLKERIRSLSIAPADLAANAAKVAGRIADHSGNGLSLYSGNNLNELSAELDGLTKSVLLVDPMVSEAAPNTSAVLHAALDHARKELDNLRHGSTFPEWSSIDNRDRKNIADAFRAVTEAVAPVNSALGLE